MPVHPDTPHSPRAGRHADPSRDELATLLHDIRSPLAAIRGLAQLVATVDPAEAIDMASAIVAQTDRLESLLGSLSGNVHDRSARVDLADVFDRIAERVDRRPRSEITVAVPRDTLVVGDPEGVFEAFWLVVDHLLRNVSDAVSVVISAGDEVVVECKPVGHACGDAGIGGFAVVAAGAIVEAAGGRLVHGGHAGCTVFLRPIVPQSLWLGP